ncbi:hypothetical protein CISG_04728 [Coccidioides immitis RMSCC 3703]|uniref:Transmembrane protein n=2 Tax=Coccidioides immitis TaxID=5501 RepID=A0A0J8QRI1_COCIT|nr:hypothetical protein CIRG_09542 [Coccidioides immitis RMSCC 2394]KMU75309.1 hypothetical protein CISG_04728 [Coccidioides immitis RMSCC 3703]
MILPPYPNSSLPILQFIDSSRQYVTNGPMISSVVEIVQYEKWIHALMGHWANLTRWVMECWMNFPHWISQPHVFAIIVAFSIAFAVTCTVCLSAGLGPIGIVGGPIAALYQTAIYSNLTPVGNIFATLASMLLTVILAFPVFVVASVIATVVAVTVWSCGAEVSPNPM